MRIHRGPGDSVSKQRPNIQTRLNSDHSNCLLDWRSPYTKRTVATFGMMRCINARLPNREYEF